MPRYASIAHNMCSSFHKAVHCNQTALLLTNHDCCAPIKAGGNILAGHRSRLPRAESKRMAKDGKPQRIILVAADDSEASESACQWAIDNLVRPGDKVHLTHVTQLPWGGFGRIIPIDTPLIYSDNVEDREIRDSIKAAKGMMTERFVPHLKDIDHNMEIVHYNRGAAEVGEVICDRAKALPAAAVVMASHNKGAIKRLFLGSTTDYCSKNCPVSLVITR